MSDDNNTNNIPTGPSDKQLLKMAMGVDTGDAEVDANANVLKLKAEWETIPSRGKDKLTKRRRVRHNMFKIIRMLSRGIEMTPEDHPDLLAIKAIIDEQLAEEQKTNKQINWYSFTFSWDIHPKNPTTLILKPVWFKEGGTFDEFGSMKPAAFTEQEID